MDINSGKFFRWDLLKFFLKVYYFSKLKAGIFEEIAHPHVLRHTTAIELLRAGIPVTAVKQLLGHASLNTTAMYLRYSNMEIQEILKIKGLI